MLKKVYLSGPYSSIPDIAPKMFDNAKNYLLENKLAERIWVPTEEIPRTSNWDDSMDICRKILNKDNFSRMIVIVNSATLSSKGVAEEIQIATQNEIPIYFLLAFGSEKDGFAKYTLMKADTFKVTD